MRISDRSAVTAGRLAVGLIALAVFASSAGPAWAQIKHSKILTLMGQQKRVFALYHTSWGARRPRMRDKTMETISVIAWQDGTIVWREKGEKGGAPNYCRGKIDPKKFKDFYTLVKALGGLQKFQDQLIPDSGHTVLSYSDGKGKTWQMLGVHEGFERNPKAVATAGGITVLGNRTREEVLAEQPEEYRNYRRVWAGIKAAMFLMIPEKGTRLDIE